MEASFNNVGVTIKYVQISNLFGWSTNLRKYTRNGDSLYVFKLFSDKRKAL